jgi:1-acyl-sn-glycerol-3-phosphate acyltransferase
MAVRIPRPRGTFPYTRPSWPRGVPRPPAESKVGADFETAWARRYPARLARAMTMDAVARPLVKLIADPTLAGLDRIQDLEGPAIFAANHASHVDTPLLLTSLPTKFRHKTVVAAGADYFFDTRWKGTLWAFAIAAFPVERTRVTRRSAELAGELLADGWSLIIFPEGGRTPDGWAQPFRGGAAFLSIRGNHPVVPVHIEGTRRILKKGGSSFRPSSTTITFGTPLRPADAEDTRALAVRIERAVTALADEQATDWWTARRRAAADASPSLAGPDAGAWRRSWALGEDKRRTRRGPVWPPTS